MFIYCIDLTQYVSRDVSTDMFGVAWSAAILVLALICLVYSRRFIDDRMHRSF